MTNESLRWGLIGCGNVVQYKSGPSLTLSGRSKVVAVMRRDKAKAEQYAAKNGIAMATDNAEAILHNPDVDIVYVATPPSMHEPYVLAAAKAKKHVLVEKPMALSAEQGRRMIDACDRAGVQLFVAYYRRFYPQVQKMRELIQAGRIGTPVQACIDVAMPVNPDSGWRETPDISGGGWFVDIATHRIDALVFLLGDIEQATGTVANFRDNPAVERLACLSLKFKSGAVAGVLGDFHTGRNSDRFSVYGAAGTVIAEHLETPRIVLQSQGNTEEFTFEAFAAPHLGLFRHIEQVFAGESENLTSGRDALITEKILDAAVRCHFPWSATARSGLR